jgi:hypothetical protein
MSADVERSQVAAVATLGPEPSVTPTPPRATVDHATATPSNGSPLKTLVTPPNPASDALNAPDTPRWRLAIAGYLLLSAGFILALTIPRLHVHAGIREEALVVASIAAMLTGAASVLASFILNLLRQP